MSISLPVPYKWSSWANFTSTLKFKNSSCTQKYRNIQSCYRNIKPYQSPSFLVVRDHLWPSDSGQFEEKKCWWFCVLPNKTPLMKIKLICSSNSPGFLETILIVSTCKNRSQQIIYNLSGPEMEGNEAHRLQHPLRVQGQTRVKLPKTTNYSNLVHPGVAVNLGVARSCPISFGHSMSFHWWLAALVSRSNLPVPKFQVPNACMSHSWVSRSLNH